MFVVDSPYRPANDIQMWPPGLPMRLPLLRRERAASCSDVQHEKLAIHGALSELERMVIETDRQLDDQCANR